MALSKERKNQIIEEVTNLLETSKMTVVAKYQGITVKSLQVLRKSASENKTSVKVIKNRLVIKALEKSKSLSEVDTTSLNGMLLYAFNSDDEVAPAQKLAEFAKSNPSLEFVGAISSDGQFMGVDKVKELAELPGKEQLIAQVVATLLSPVNDVTNALSGNLHALLDGVADSAKQ